MYKLACSDLGTPECGFVAQADTSEEVVKKMIEHAKMAHSDKIEEMSKTMSEEEIEKMMASKVKQG